MACFRSFRTKRGAHIGDFVRVAGVYPAGRLDRDSEGLMVLTSDGALQHKITHPDHKMSKTYWVQVEGAPRKRTWLPSAKACR